MIFYFRLAKLCPKGIYFFRREGLAEALAAGLLRPRGVVATNFLPHVDLAMTSVTCDLVAT